MQLPRHALRSHVPQPAYLSAYLSVALPPDGVPPRAGCATRDGFLVAQLPDLSLLTRRVFSHGDAGIAAAVPVGGTSLLALRGSAGCAFVAPTKVVLWDEAADSTVVPQKSTLFSASSSLLPDEQAPPRASAPDPQAAPGRAHGKPVAELAFHSDVLGVHAASVPRHARAASTNGDADACALLCVTLLHRAVVLELSGGDGAAWSVRERLCVETDANEAGLATLGYLEEAHAAVLALPGRSTGQVQVLQLPMAADAPPGNSGTTLFIASRSPLAALQLWHGGSVLATASKRGTLVRVWHIASAPQDHQPARSTLKVRLLRELRRGADSAEIYGLAFSPDAVLLAVVSDKGTVHVFGCAPPSPAPSAPPPTGLLPAYLRSEWSSAQFHVPLQTFPSYARAVAAGSTGAPRDAPEPTGEEAPPTAAENYEGAWARTRARVADVRAHHAPVHERVQLTWAPDGGALYVLTSAGACYVLALDTQPSGDGIGNEAHVPHKERQQTQPSVLPHLAHASRGCHLVEFATLNFADPDLL